MPVVGQGCFVVEPDIPELTVLSSSGLSLILREEQVTHSEELERSSDQRT